MRIALFVTLLLSLFATLFALPLMAKTYNDARLPAGIEKPLHDAVATGDQKILASEEARMTAQNPTYNGRIHAYVSHVLEPATRVMAVINQMKTEPASTGKAQAADKDVAALARDMNNISVGSGQ